MKSLRASLLLIGGLAATIVLVSAVESTAEKASFEMYESTTYKDEDAFLRQTLSDEITLTNRKVEEGKKNKILLMCI